MTGTTAMTQQENDSDGLPREVALQRLRACLAVACILCGVVTAGLAFRVEGHRWGWILTPQVLGELQVARNVHAAVLGLLLALLAATRFLRSCPPVLPRLGLAALPVLILLSVDRLLAIRVAPLPPVEAHPCMPHPRRDWALRPGWVGHDGRSEARINNVGLRGPDIPWKKPAGEYRLVFLGDSVTFGTAVRYDETFVARVGDLLRRTTGADGLRTVNLAVPAYSPWQEHDLLADEGLRLEPDAILYVFCLNDVLERFYFARFGGYMRGLAPPAPSVLEWSGLYRAIRSWRAGMVRPSEASLWELRGAYSIDRLFLEPDAPAVQRGWAMALEEVGDIVQLAADHSIPLAIVCAPVRIQVGQEKEGFSLPQSRLKRFAEKMGVPFLDLLPALRREGNSGTHTPHTLFADGVHLSADGHAVAAEAIGAFLTELGWLTDGR